MIFGRLEARQIHGVSVINTKNARKILGLELSEGFLEW